MSTAVWIAILLVAGLMAYVRLAPSDPALWHIDLVANRPSVPAAGADTVVVLRNGAFADIALPRAEAEARLVQIADIAARTPRTRVIAGSAAAGHITWETRSLLWGFPDYTTAQITPAGLSVYARLRFGQSDLGVNAARLRLWLAGR